MSDDTVISILQTNSFKSLYLQVIEKELFQLKGMRISQQAVDLYMNYLIQIPIDLARLRYAPIQSDKHEITWSNIAQDASSKVSILLATAVQPASKNLASEVGIGSKIPWIYFEFHFSPETTTSANVIHWEIVQLRKGQTFANPNVYYQLERSQIIKRGMEMLPRDQSTVFKRIFTVKLPRIFQRQKENQELYLVYQASLPATINACGIAIYKEIYQMKRKSENMFTSFKSSEKDFYSVIIKQLDWCVPEASQIYRYLY